MTDPELEYIARRLALRRADRETDLVKSVGECLSRHDPLSYDIDVLMCTVQEAMEAGEESPELATWNELWSRTVLACRKRVC